MIGYDDQGKPDELLKLTTRLIEEDKVDMLLAPYATHMNIASAPITNKYGFPVIYPTATTTTTYEFSKKFPFAFWQIAQPNEATGPLAEYLGQLMKEGKIKGRVATMHPAIEYGVQMNTAFQAAAKKAGLEVVFNRSYPFGASDLQPVIREMMGSKPDAAIAFSYPPDTFMLTEQMQIVGFNPEVMYVAIGGVFPTYKGKFGDKVNGILAYGGQDVSLPEYQAYLKAHREMHMRDSEAGALSTYSALEITQQAIERVGELDRQKIRDEIAGGTFKTVWGELSYTDQRCAQAWAVGQWQDGELHGVLPKDKQGAKPIQFPKPKWS
jgi:branched-chain amino acid transport system substrate-binding protein